MKRHMFICPRCGEPTRELFAGVHCFDCAEVLRESEEVEGQGLVHRASEIASPVIGHPGSY